MKQDIEKFRKKLTDYYGTAIYNGFPMAVSDLLVVESASEDKLADIARQQGWKIGEN